MFSGLLISSFYNESDCELNDVQVNRFPYLSPYFPFPVLALRVPQGRISFPAQSVVSCQASAPPHTTS